jgi:hypothetical protein
MPIIAERMIEWNQAAARFEIQTEPKRRAVGE